MQSARLSQIQPHLSQETSIQTPLLESPNMDKDVTVDADLGWLERLIPAKQAQAAIESGVKGLLS